MPRQIKHVVHSTPETHHSSRSLVQALWVLLIVANLIEHVLPQVLDDGASRGTVRGELVERVVTDGPPPRRVLVTHELNPRSDDLLVFECIELLEGESRHRVRLETAREGQLELEAKVDVALDVRVVVACEVARRDRLVLEADGRLDVALARAAGAAVAAALALASRSASSPSSIKACVFFLFLSIVSMSKSPKSCQQAPKSDKKSMQKC